MGALTCLVSYIPPDADLAFFPILGACRPTDLGKPRWAGPSSATPGTACSARISDTSWSIACVVLSLGNLPGPGESGSPLIQDGKVVGLLLYLNMHTCKGIAISAEMIRREIQI